MRKGYQKPNQSAAPKLCQHLDIPIKKFNDEKFQANMEKLGYCISFFINL